MARRSFASTTSTGGTNSAGGASARSAPDADRRRKLALSALVALAAVALVTQNSEATFTATAARGHSIVTGTPMLVLGATGSATNRLGIDVVGLTPGVSAYRSFNLSNVGDSTMTAYSLSTVVTTSSLLDSDRTNGLQVKLERCSTAWTETGTSPSFSYTCPGTRTTVLGPTPIAMSNAVLPGMVSAAPGGTDHLLLTETLPASADNTFQGLTSAVTFTFNATA